MDEMSEQERRDKAARLIEAIMETEAKYGRDFTAKIIWSLMPDEAKAAYRKARGHSFDEH